MEPPLNGAVKAGSARLESIKLCLTTQAWLHQSPRPTLDTRARQALHKARDKVTQSPANLEGKKLQTLQARRSAP